MNRWFELRSVIRQIYKNLNDKKGNGAFHHDYQEFFFITLSYCFQSIPINCNLIMNVLGHMVSREKWYQQRQTNSSQYLKMSWNEIFLEKVERNGNYFSEISIDKVIFALKKSKFMENIVGFVDGIRSFWKKMQSILRWFI